MMHYVDRFSLVPVGEMSHSWEIHQSLNSMGFHCFLRVPMLGLRFPARGLGFRETFRVPRELQNESVNLDSTCPDSLVRPGTI